MVAEPALTPVTTPVPEPTVTVASPLLQLPVPDSDKVVVWPTHTVLVPDTEPSALTVSE